MGPTTTNQLVGCWLVADGAKQPSGGLLMGRWWVADGTNHSQPTGGLLMGSWWITDGTLADNEEMQVGY